MPCTTENSDRAVAPVRGKQDLWQLRRVETQTSWRGVPVDCAHTLPRFPNRDRGKHSRRRRTNSTNSSRLVAQVESMAQAEHCSAPRVVPFRKFQPFVLFSCNSRIGESTRIRGTQEIRARLSAEKRPGALARSPRPHSKIPGLLWRRS